MNPYVPFENSCTPAGTGEFYYRFIDKKYAPGVNDFGDIVPGSGTIGILLERWNIKKRTPKGIWLERYGYSRFVLNTAYKKFACPTVEEAKTSFIKRKERQASIYRARMQEAEAVLAKVKTL